jgi:hypothetical protein
MTGWDRPPERWAAGACRSRGEWHVVTRARRIHRGRRRWAQLPEQLLEPEIAHQDAQLRQAGAAAFAQDDRRGHSALLRGNASDLFRLAHRRRHTHKNSYSHLKYGINSYRFYHEQARFSLRPAA